MSVKRARCPPNVRQIREMSAKQKTYKKALQKVAKNLSGDEHVEDKYLLHEIT
jgi:predicted metal-binding protein